jgi:hypothetical protein
MAVKAPVCVAVVLLALSACTAAPPTTTPPTGTTQGVSSPTRPTATPTAGTATAHPSPSSSMGGGMGMGGMSPSPTTGAHGASEVTPVGVEPVSMPRPLHGEGLSAPIPQERSRRVKVDVNLTDAATGKLKPAVEPPSLWWHAPPRTTASSPTSCATARIRSSFGFIINQTTSYCWYDNGSDLDRIGPPLLSGSVAPDLQTALVAWRGIDTTYSQCYQAYGRARGYCVQTAWGHFRQNIPGGHNLKVWTMVRTYYNGFAECANSRDNMWASCNR